MSIASILNKTQRVAKIAGVLLLAIIIALAAFHLIGWAIKLAIFTVLVYFIYHWLLSKSAE